MSTDSTTRPAVSDVALELSARLCSWQVRIADVATKLDVSQAFANAAVVRCEVRAEFAGAVDPIRDLFAQENAVMVQVERDAAGAVRWDEGLLADRALLGPTGISHYLIDTSRIHLVLGAVRRHPILDPDARARIMADAAI